MGNEMTDRYNGWSKYGYFQWLLEIINCPRSEDYEELLRILHSIPFTYILPMDRNRALDGVSLRFRYLDEEGAPYSIDKNIEDISCSCLEMMIAMAERFCYDVIGEHFKTTADYFWIMIKNLGLFDFTNDRINENEVRERVRIMLLRKYAKDGYGGLFPLRNPGKDQRKIELWYQLHAWFNENYY